MVIVSKNIVPIKYTLTELGLTVAFSCKQDCYHNVFVSS